MSVTTADRPASGNSTRLVVAASAIGTAFEWYDFFIFGTLAAVIGGKFTGGDETSAFIVALGAFAAGFFVRPFGALFFGRFGDRVGRKAAFLVTITLMGVATVAIGLMPTAAQIGSTAAVLLVFLRVVQGFALGGEYGGAAIYVAEHAPDHRRGYYTSWIQTSAAFGLVGALAVILATRTIMGEERFTDWGWRLPFLLSLVLLIVSLWIRMRLEESPEFQRMKEEEGISKAPYAEAFARWPNLRLVLIALFGVMLAQGAVWYAGHFYAQFFLEKVLKVPGPTVNLLLIAAVLISAALYVFFGWLSDRVGRKPVMMFGMLLFIVTVFPAFRIMSEAANPAMVEASRSAPVTVVSDPADCSVQFDPLGRRQFTSACDVARRVLSDAGVPYRNVSQPGAEAAVRVGATQVPSRSVAGLAKDEAKAARAQVGDGVKAALAGAGYPAAAAPERINLPLVFGVLLVFIVAATAVYGPQAAALVELFPTRVRYTALSLPYHIGTGWVGGFLPVVAFAMVAASGDLYFGLWYPLVFTAISLVTMFFLFPETRGRKLS